MKKKLLPLALAVAILLMAGLAAWLLYTEAGARCVADRLLRLLPGRVETGIISGTLAGELAVADLRITGEGWRVQIRRTVLQWRPWELWAGRICLGKVRMENPEVQDDRPVEPFDLSWPRFPGTLSWFRGGIAALEIRDLVWRLPGTAILISSGQSSLDYTYGLARFPDLTLTVPAGKIAGDVRLHLTSPFLAAVVKFTPGKGAHLPPASLRTALRAPAGSRYLQGPFAVAVRDGERERFILKGQAACSARIVSLTGIAAAESGRRGMIRGEGSIDLSRRRSHLAAAVKIENLDLSPEAGREFTLGGEIDMAGDAASYQGRFRFLPRLGGGKAGEIRGDFHGDAERLAVENLRMPLGRGLVRGRAAVGWKGEWTARWELQARDIEPSLAALRAPGRINVDLEGNWRRAAGGAGAGTMTGRMLDSRLAGRTLTGQTALRWQGEAVDLQTLQIRGEGFRASAHGDLRDRIAYEAAISNLGVFLPGGAGRLQGQGWLRYRGSRLSGNLTATGKGIVWKQAGMDSLSASLAVGAGPDGLLAGKITAQHLHGGGMRWSQAEVQVAGTKRQHGVILQIAAPEDSWRLTAAGGWGPGVWTGAIREVTGASRQHGALRLVRPASLVVSRHKLELAPVLLAGPQGERLEISARRDGARHEERLQATWQALPLGRLPRPSAEANLAGRTAGELRLERAGREGFRVDGTARFQGEVSRGSRLLPVWDADCRLRWQEKGLEFAGDLDLGPAGRVTARLSSPAAPALSLPGAGNFSATLAAMDLKVLQPFLPERLHPAGLLSGSLEGQLLPQRRFVMTGQARVTRGVWTVAGPKGALDFSLERLELAWHWQEDALRGTVSSELTDAGRLQASFRLPVNARFPWQLDRQRAVSAAVKGEIRETGLLGAIFPGTIRETRGQLAGELALTGTWQRPRYEGTLLLSQAGAYVPAAGIRLEEVAGTVRFFPERIEVESFSARSGPGRLQGRATIRYGDGSIKEIKGVLAGERFQAAYLPEIQLLASPRLQFAGDRKHLSVTGDVHIPEGRYAESREPELVRPSRDVRVVDRAVKKRPAAPFSLDMAVTFTLGDKVFMKTRDLEGRFSGKMIATGKNPEDMQTRGEIHIDQGFLHAANTKLPIERGHIYFKDKPFSLATLDILAVKQVGDVRAGFLVTGALRSPVATLYSVPSLPDQDVLAYIAFGTSYTGDKIQAATLLKSAGMFLAQGKSGGLEDSLRRSAGLEVGGGAALQSRNKQGRTDMTTSLSTVGQYLSPQLYVGLGRAMFSDDILYIMKYSFSRRWEVETKAGRQSSIDLYYKVEFD